VFPRLSAPLGQGVLERHRQPLLLDVLEARLQCLMDLSIECSTADDQGVTAGRMRQPPEAPSAKRWCW